MKYCKKLFALLAAALLCMALTLPARAAAPLVRDECGVFDADTLADLEEQAESASDGHDVDVYFLVVDDIGDADQRDYAKNYYIANGLGYGDEQSGILFLLAVGIAMIGFGLWRGEADTVLSKAIRLCMECVGIG